LTSGQWFYKLNHCRLLADVGAPWIRRERESEDAMKGRHGLSRTIVLTISVILPLSLAEVKEYEPSGLHLDVEVDENQFPKSVPAMTRPLPDDGRASQPLRCIQAPPASLRTGECRFLLLATGRNRGRISTVLRI